MTKLQLQQELFKTRSQMLRTFTGLGLLVPDERGNAAADGVQPAEGFSAVVR